jgi:preprotein translocase subunit YajC
MKKSELIVSLILADFFYYVVIFLIVYYIYKMDQKGRKVLKERNKVD